MLAEKGLRSQKQAFLPGPLQAWENAGSFVACWLPYLAGAYLAVPR